MRKWVKKKNNNIIIDLIAVNKNFRKKGYGEELIRSINSFTKINYNKILVGTELSNISAINLYLKIGFKLIFSTHSFHLHKYN